MIKRLAWLLLAIAAPAWAGFDLSPLLTQPEIQAITPAELAPTQLATNYVGITQAPLLQVTVTCPPSIADCGVITSSPAGLNCHATSGTCSYPFTSGTSVTLTATGNASTGSSTVYGSGTQGDGNWTGTGSASGCTSTAATAACGAFTFNTATTAGVAFAPKDVDVWWVGKTGADSGNDCRTRSTACLTVNHGMSLISAGDTLYVDDGTYAESMGGTNGSSTNLNVVSGTPVKRTRYFSYHANKAIIDAGYQGAGAVYFWKVSHLEVGYLKFLHGTCSTDGSSNENGGTVAVLTPHFTAGALSSVTVTSGGGGFANNSSWLGASYGGTGSGMGFTIHTNGSGVISSVDTIVGGSGYGTGTGVEIYPSLRVSDVYFHDIGCGYPSTAGGPGGGVSGVNLVACNACTVENTWVWGYGMRYGIAAYRSPHSRLRRNVARYDGSTDGNPRAGVVQYDVDDGIAENNVVIDFDAGSDSSTYSHNNFFTTCSLVQTGGYPYGLGQFAWYGNVGTNTVGAGNTASFTIDSNCSTKTGLAGSTTATAVVVNNSFGKNSSTSTLGIQTWLEGDTAASVNGGAHSATFDHNAMYDQYDASSLARVLRFDTWTVASMQNNYIESPDASTTGCFENHAASTITTSADNFHISCNDARYTATPGGSATNPGVKYLLRCEGPTYGTSSIACTGAASDGGDVGPTIVNRYNNGSLTGTPLWPFPNEAEIRSDFCAGPDDITTALESVATNGSAIGVASGAGDKTVNGNTYYITAVGTSVNWTSIGASSSALGTKFTRNATAATGSGGTAGPNIYTRGHNAAANMLCGGSKSLTAYLWEQLGNPSPF